MDQETYEKQKAFAGEKVPSMHRRMVGHDYQERQMYMITMVTEDRRPLLGQVVGRSDGQPGSPDLPRTEPTELGRCVEQCWHEIALRYPQIEVLAFQLMPDHFHSSDPVFHGMTTKQKEDYAKAIAGEYKGTYVIIYNDGGSDTKAVKKEGVQMTVTDLTMHSVCFHDYPVSLLSNVVADRALAEALAGAPNVDFLVDYRFYNLQDNGDVNWGFEPAAIPLTLHYGGTDHHLMLKLDSQTYFLLSKADLDAGKPFANQSVFQFDVAGIYEGHTLLQAFDDWQDNSAEYLTYFQFE